MAKVKKKKQKAKQIKAVATNNNYLNAKIKELQEEIELLQDIGHNNGVNGAVKHYRQGLIERATDAELRFKHVAEMKHLKLRFQHRIDILKGNRIEKVYYVDFCDVDNKLVFEIDGGYHFTEEQIKLDQKRTRQLAKMGYKVYRITNQEVMAGGTTAFLYNIYKTKGISLIK